MTTDYPTLLGDIPGLLRRGSPCLEGAAQVVVTFLSGETVWVCDQSGNAGEAMIRNLALDLSDPTGQVHAAWWLRERILEDEDGLAELRHGTRYLRLQAMKGRLTPDEARRLTKAVLHVAGREA